MKITVIECPKSGCGLPSPEIYTIDNDCVHYCKEHGEFRICANGDIQWKKVRTKQIVSWKSMPFYEL